jgi:predicted NBD/HSP70 family sugar kinase
MGPTTATLPGAALALIHTGQAPTRSALTARLGVTRATTGAIVGELRDLRLIQVAAAAGGGQQGRPSHRLLPDPDGPVALAAELYTDGFAVALVGLGATIVARHSRDLPVSADPEQALAPVSAAAAALLGRSGRPCVGAAVALPAAVTEPAGATVGALYFGWPDGAKVRDLFAAQLTGHGVTGPDGAPLHLGALQLGALQLGAPHLGALQLGAPQLGAPGGSRAPRACHAVNDVNAVALAEHRHGAGRDSAHLLVVAATRRGVGSALVLRGALYTGSTGLAMEAGHVSIDPRGRPCPCGSRGCLNVETDAGRFLDAAGRLPDRGAEPLDAAIALLTAGYATDPRVREAASTLVDRLGLGLASLVNVVNPDRVLLGGLHKHLLLAAPEQLRDAVAARSPWGRGGAVPISPCALDDAALIGAAELAWQPVLDNPALLRRPA